MIARFCHAAVFCACALALAACKDPDKDARARAFVDEKASAASTQNGSAPQDAPPQSAPPQSAPPQSAPPQSAPPQNAPQPSAPPQSAPSPRAQQPTPGPTTVSRCVAGWSPAEAANEPLKREGDCWTKPSSGTSLGRYPKGDALCVRDHSKQTIAGPLVPYDMVEVVANLKGATQPTRCWTECKYIAAGNANCGR